MPRHRRRDPMFRYRRHGEEIIVLAIGWYICRTYVECLH
jgi:hypothetical protein